VERSDYKWRLFGRSTAPPKRAVKIGKIVTPAFRLFSTNEFSDSNQGLKIYWPSVTAMDRTKNLLDKISSFPPPRAEACVLVSQPASETLPAESLSVDAVVDAINSLDSIRTTSDMEKLLDESERAIDSDDDVQAFSRDPYVATPAAGLADFRSWKKRSIEEILDTIHGYQSHGDEANETVENEAVVDIASELELDVNNFCCPSASEPVRATDQPAPIRVGDVDAVTRLDDPTHLLSGHPGVEAHEHAVGPEATRLATITVVTDEVPRSPPPDDAVRLDGPDTGAPIGGPVAEADDAMLDDRRGEAVDIGDGEADAGGRYVHRCRFGSSCGDLRERERDVLPTEHVDGERQGRDLIGVKTDVT
jgi:hypothetical protein